MSTEPSDPVRPFAAAPGVCLIVQPIHAAGLAQLRAAGLEIRAATGLAPAILAREAADCVAVVTRNGGFPAEAVLAAPRLRVIGVHGTGTDPVAVPEATRAGIAVVNTPGANALSVAEHAIGLIFALFGVGMTLITQNGIFDVIGTALIGVLLVCVAIALAIETQSLLIGESASPEVRTKIAEALAAVDGVDRLIHMKTLHLGPDELLVAAKIGVTASTSAADVAATIDAAESAVRAAEPLATAIYL